MPGLEQRDLYQRAVLWPRIGYDPFGQAAVGSPVEIAVRRLDVKREVLDPKGNTISIDAQAVVALFVPVDSHIWLAPAGTPAGQAIETWYSTGSAGQPDDLCSVKVWNGTPDIKNRNQRYTLGLMRLHDANTP